MSVTFKVLPQSKRLERDAFGLDAEPETEGNWPVGDPVTMVYVTIAARSVDIFRLCMTFNTSAASR